MNTYPTVAWLTELDLPWVTRQSWANPNIAGSTFWAAAAMSRPITKIVVHSTETVGFPGYRNGADNPHFTQNLTTGSCRQHVPLTHGARALEVRATSEANIGGVIQIELIGACTPGYPEQYGHYDLVKKFPVDEQAQFYLARLLAVLHDVTGVTLETTVEWVAYPASYGDAAVQRLTVAEFFAYVGVLAHEHVPGNSHGDPGNLGGAIHKVLAKARALITNPNTPEVPVSTDQNGYAPEEYGSVHHVARVQTGLKALGLYTGPIRGGVGPLTGAAVLAFQKSVPGLAQDSDPGPATTTALSTATDVVALKKAHAAAMAKSVADGNRVYDALREELAQTREDHAEELTTLRAVLEAEVAEAERDAQDARAQLAAVQADMAVLDSELTDALVRVTDLTAALAAAQGTDPTPAPSEVPAAVVTALAQANALLTHALALTAQTTD